MIYGLQYLTDSQREEIYLNRKNMVDSSIPKNNKPFELNPVGGPR